MFEKQVSKEYSKIFENKIYTHKVLSILTHSLKETLTVNKAAEKTGLTVRNLQMKLKEEGTTYSQLRDQIQCDLAVNYLLSGNHSAAEIGTILGFSEPSAFYRTFKRWTGKTPKEYSLSGS